jgi:Ca2+-binding EF-hand superfamily protein
VTAAAAAAAGALGYYLLCKPATEIFNIDPEINKVDNETKAAIAKVKADLDEIWRALDDDHNGEVSKEELLKALNRKGTKEDTRVRKLIAGTAGGHFAFENLDFDQNGKISKDEFYAMYYLEANLAKMFKIADTDSDGAVTKQELKKLLQEYPEMEILIGRRGGMGKMYVLEQLDEDSDGKITLQEFMMALHENQAAVELFEKLDKNHDGSISTKELSDGLKKNGNFMRQFEAVGMKEDTVWEQLDKDHDGTITFEEFSKRMKSLKNIQGMPLARRPSHKLRTDAEEPAQAEQ